MVEQISKRYRWSSSQSLSLSTRQCFKNHYSHSHYINEEKKHTAIIT